MTSTRPTTDATAPMPTGKSRGEMATACAHKADELLRAGREGAALVAYQEAAEHAEAALAATPSDKPRTMAVYRSNAEMLRIKAQGITPEMRARARAGLADG